MLTKTELEAMTVNEIMKRWPTTIRLFIDRRLLCVGCPIAPFHYLADVAAEHGVDQTELVDAVFGLVVGEVTTGVPASAHRRSARVREGRRP